jgi:hypothetical protein
MSEVLDETYKPVAAEDIAFFQESKIMYMLFLKVRYL